MTSAATAEVGTPLDDAATHVGAPPTDAPPADAPPTDAPPRRRRTGWRWPAVVALVLLLAAVSGLLLLRPTTAGGLDPDDASPDGARALAHVLRDHGVSVQTPRTFAAATAALDGRGATSTLVVTRPDLMSPSRGGDLRRLLDATGADLVLVAPGDTLLADLDLPVTGGGAVVTPELRAPDCTDDVALRAGSAYAGGRLYRVTAAGQGSAAGCYAAGRRDVPYVGVRTANGGHASVLGTGEALRNGRLAEAGDAALATGLLGRRSQVVWWTPTALDGSTVQDPPGLGDLLPAGVRYGALQLVVVLLVVVLWRVRRLGRLVPERLPVVVRAVETTQGRARLYRRARARGRSAQVLRAAAVRRLALRCGLPRTARPAEVVAVAAARTGRSTGDVAALLTGPDPVDDTSLVALARELDTLETEVRRP